MTKAWVAEARDADRGMAVIWADTRNEARALAANELELSYVEITSVRRKPELDEFEGDLLQWQIDDGWRWECGQCGRSASKDTGYVIYQGTPEVYGGFKTTPARHVLCSQKCADKLKAWHDERDRVQAECLAEFAKMHPGVEARSTICNEYNWIVDAGPPLNRYVTVRVLKKTAMEEAMEKARHSS